MNIRLSNYKDYKNIRELWEDVFPEDSKEYLDFYFDVVMQENTVIVAENTLQSSHNLAAMLHLNPYTVSYDNQEFNIYYIVAVATRSEYRRQGLMRKMLDYAHSYAIENHIDYFILLPADERYYRPFAFEFVSRQYNTTLYMDKYLNTDNQKQLQGFDSKPLTREAFSFCFLNHTFEEDEKFVPKPTQALANRIYEETISENGNIYAVDNNLILLYQYDEGKGKKMEVRKIYYNKDCDDVIKNYETVKEFLISISNGLPMIVHEVEKRKVTDHFAYNKQNIYDYRPYMMIKKISHKDRRIHQAYFDEMV